MYGELFTCLFICFILFSVVLCLFGIYDLFAGKFKDSFFELLGCLIVGLSLWFVWYKVIYQNLSIANEIKRKPDVVKLVNYAPLNYRCYGDDCVTYFIYLDDRDGKEKEVSFNVKSRDAREKLRYIFETRYRENFNLYIRRVSGKTYIELIESKDEENFHWYDFIFNDDIRMTFDGI